MDVLIVHNITNITKPCGNQTETWTVDGAPQNWQKTISCVYIYIYVCMYIYTYIYIKLVETMNLSKSYKFAT